MSISMTYLIDNFADLCNIVDALTVQAQAGEYISGATYDFWVGCKMNVLSTMIENGVF